MSSANEKRFLKEGSGKLFEGAREVLAGLINFFNPESIFIGGGVTNFGDILLSAIRLSVLRRSLPLATRKLMIQYSTLGSDAGVMGAIYLAIENVFVLGE